MILAHNGSVMYKSGMKLAIKQTDNDLFFSVKAVPGSSRTRITGLWNSVLKVNIASEAQKDKANKELVSFLAKLLKLPKSSISIVSGQHNSRKQIHITHFTARQLQEILEPYLC